MDAGGHTVDPTLGLSSSHGAHDGGQRDKYYTGARVHGEGGTAPTDEAEKTAPGTAPTEATDGGTANRPAVMDGAERLARGETAEQWPMKARGPGGTDGPCGMARES